MMGSKEKGDGKLAPEIRVDALLYTHKRVLDAHEKGVETHRVDVGTFQRTCGHGNTQAVLDTPLGLFLDLIITLEHRVE